MDEQELFKEKTRLLKEYNCQTIEEVIQLLQAIIDRKINKH